MSEERSDDVDAIVTRARIEVRGSCLAIGFP